MISLNSTMPSEPKTRFVLIHGPSHITLTKGSLEVFGAPISRGEAFVVPRGKTTPAILGSGTCASDLQVRSGAGGALEFVKENPIPPSWDNLADQLITVQNGLWMVIGGPDTGKTGLITFLTNQCLRNKRKTAIIDADIGQSCIGPPTTIGLAIPSTPEVFLSNHKMQTGYFVGSTSPRGHLLQTCCGVRKLVNAAYGQGIEIILLDTSGYIQNSAARVLKYHKAQLVEPSTILALQRSNELEHILTTLDGLGSIVRLAPPPSVQLKNFDHRAIYRETQFKKLFSDARPKTFLLKDVQLLGTSLGLEIPVVAHEKLINLLNTRILWAQKNPDRLLLVIDGHFNEQNIDLVKDEFGVKQINFISYRDLQGLIVGLLDENHTLVALGLLQDIYFDEKIVVRTYVSCTERVKFITLGRIQLSPEGVQLGRIPTGYI